MDRYKVYLLPGAYRDIDGIYGYIAEHICAPGAAEDLVDGIEKAILSLDTFPHRGSKRRRGPYRGNEYRQIFVKNFAIIYRIVEERREVIVVTVRYKAMQ